MNCRDSESLILAERDGALTGNQLAGLSDHVATCPACARFRAEVAAALEAYHAGLAAMPQPEVDEAWRQVQARMHGAASQAPRKRPLAPVIWFAAPVAAAAALALAFILSRPTPVTPANDVALTPPPYDPSVIAGADFVEAGDPNASTMVYVDKESGWLVVWATDVDSKNNG